MTSRAFRPLRLLLAPLFTLASGMPDLGGDRKTSESLFMERTGAKRQSYRIPADYVVIDVPDGVVCDAVFVERTAPEALHSEESREEDDSFLSVGTRPGITKLPAAVRKSFLPRSKTHKWPSSACPCVTTRALPEP